MLGLFRLQFQGTTFVTSSHILQAKIEREKKAYPLSGLVWNVMIYALWLLKLLQKQTQKVTEGGANGSKQKWKIMSFAEHPYPPNRKSIGPFKKQWDKTWTHFATTVYTSNTLMTTCQRQLKLQQKLEKLPQQQSTKKTMYKSNTIILCSVHVRDDAFAIHSCHWGL